VHEFIYENENVALEDRSILIRKLMLEKTFVIFSEHPLTGIGLNNFGNYKVDFIGNFEGGQLVVNKVGLDQTSAHNSYASLLGEGGLFLIVPFILLLLFNLYKFIFHFTYRSQIQNAFYWAFLCMCIHLYLISALLSISAWFFIGLLTALSVRSNTKQIGMLF
jgi:O-antigen ligase